MPVNVPLSIVLATSAWALWIRRQAVGCRWETAPTVMVALAGACAYLTSGHASSALGRPLHAVTGLWNVEDLLGHIAFISSVSTAIYMFLTRLASDETLQRLYAQWVGRPLTLSIPTLIVCHINGVGGRDYLKQFANLRPQADWLILYWVTLAITLVYLLGYAMRILLLLRGPGDARSVLNLYVATITLTGVSIVLVAAHVITPLAFGASARPIAYLALLGWVVTPAYSWLRKSRPLHIPSDGALTKPTGDATPA